MDNKIERTQGAASLFEDWLRNNFKISRILELILLVEGLATGWHAIQNGLAGLAKSDWWTTLLLGVVWIIALLLYFLTRTLEASVYKFEAQTKYDIRLINPKNIEDMLAKSVRDLRNAAEVNGVTETKKLEQLQKEMKELSPDTPPPGT